jgi:hypothetical protein
VQDPRGWYGCSPPRDFSPLAFTQKPPTYSRWTSDVLAARQILLHAVVRLLGEQEVESLSLLASGVVERMVSAW